MLRGLAGSSESCLLSRVTCCRMSWRSALSPPDAGAACAAIIARAVSLSRFALCRSHALSLSRTHEHARSDALSHPPTPNHTHTHPHAHRHKHPPTACLRLRLRLARCPCGRCSRQPSGSLTQLACVSRARGTGHYIVTFVYENRTLAPIEAARCSQRARRRECPGREGCVLLPKCLSSRA